MTDEKKNVVADDAGKPLIRNNPFSGAADKAAKQIWQAKAGSHQGRLDRDLQTRGSHMEKAKAARRVKK